MKHSIAFPVLICLLISSSLVFAENIYKWVDSEGVVHYGSQPPSGKQAKEMNIHNTPAASAPTPAAQPTAEPQPSFMESYEKEQKDKTEAADKAAKEKEMLDKNCSLARKRLAGYQQGGHIYEMDEKGERNYLSDEELGKRLKQAQDDVAKWCQ